VRHAHGGPLELVEVAAAERHGGVQVAFVVDRHDSLASAGPPLGLVPDRREEVGAERPLGALAAPDQVEDLRERLRDDVLRLLPVPEVPGEAVGGVGVPSEQRGVRLRAAATSQRDELGVVELGEREPGVGPGDVGFGHEESPGSRGSARS
jgi:hypothetical protein